MSARDELRSKIFSKQNRERKRSKMRLFGVDLEFKQPTIKEMLDLSGSDAKDALFNSLISFAVVPGTDEPVFDKADKDELMSMPYSDEITKISDTLTNMTGIEIQTEEAAGN